MPIALPDIEAAAARLQQVVRRTPVMLWHPRPSLPGLSDAVRVFLKLEQLQVGGSFKLRGAMNLLLQADPAALARGVFTASGGNHGIGVAYAARARGVAVQVHLPQGAPQRTETLLRGLGAEVLRGGTDWQDAWDRATGAAAQAGGLLVHPFDPPEVIAGQGTLGLELLEDVPDADLVVCAVGGGGMIGGVATVVRGRTCGLPGGPALVVGVEPEGAAGMSRSLAAGRPVRLDQVTTIAGTLAPRGPSQRTFDLCRGLCAGVALVSDDDLQQAVALCWDDLRLTLEPAGAATVAVVLSGKLDPAWLREARTVVLLVCGANP